MPGCVIAVAASLYSLNYSLDSVLKPQAAKHSIFDSNANGRRQLAFTVLLLMALCASALGGAWVYARFYVSAGAAHHERLLTGQVSHDAAHARDNLAVLADKVGALQAQIIAVKGLGHRVAEAAGVEYTEPELRDSLPFGKVGEPDSPEALYLEDARPAVTLPMSLPGQLPESDSAMDFIDPPVMQDITYEGLGRRLDSLFHQVRVQEDGLAMLDLMLTRRAGVEASLPSYSPVDYPYLSSSFGWRRNPVTGRHSMHEGLDFAAPHGTPIYAASGGVVTQARFRSGYGNLVEIMHGNGIATRYAHASKIKVKEGDLVDPGQVVALVGSTGRSTGAHLHFEVRIAGHALDPSLFLPPQPAEQLIADAGDHLPATATKVR